MAIHNFSVDTGDPSHGKYYSIHESFRSDIEQRHSPLAIHDEESPDIKMARRMAEEMINVSGAEVKVHTRTDNADNDNVWDEDADPTYWPAVNMKAFFKPEPLHQELLEFGVDHENSTEIVFSHYQVITKFGKRMLRTGDVIQIPYNDAYFQNKNYRVLNATPTGNFRYVWLYLTCHVQILTADITVRTEEDMPQEEPLRTGGVYRESL